MDRALIREDDYRRFAGRKVDVSLYSAYSGRKAYAEVDLVGLKELEGGKKVLVFDETPVIPAKKKGMPVKYGETERFEIPFEQVSKVKLSVIF